MGDINLLPEDLRNRELSARQAAAAGSGAPEFSRPEELAHKPVEGSAPGRWQQLMSALKKNVDSSPLPVKPTTPTIKAEPVKNNVVPQPTKVSAMPPTSATPKPAAPAAKPGKSFAVSQRPGVSQPPPTVLDVNLLPAQAGQPLSRQAVSGMIILVVGVTVLVIAGYVVLRVMVNRQTATTEAIQQEVIELQQQLETARASAEGAIAVQSRIQKLADLLNKQGHWQGFFTFLEKSTTPVVQLTTLAADANGKIIISGLAPNFTEVGRQMLAYQQSKEVLEVNLTSINIETRRGDEGEAGQIAKFTFALSLSPDLFIAVVD